MLPDLLAGKKTYIAAILAGILAANAELKFIPEQYITMLTYIASALGLWGVRSAMARLGCDNCLPQPAVQVARPPSGVLLLAVVCLGLMGCKATQTAPATKPCCPDGKCPPAALVLECGCAKCDCCGACAR